MNNRKNTIRFFSIADYGEEEVWLHDQHKNGWKLSRMIPPCFYIFEKCTPEDVAYRLDYKNNTETNNYFQIFRDYGWEYIGVLDGCIFANRYQKQIPNKMAKSFLTTSQGLRLLTMWKKLVYFHA